MRYIRGEARNSGAWSMMENDDPKGTVVVALHSGQPAVQTGSFTVQQATELRDALNAWLVQQESP